MHTFIAFNKCKLIRVIGSPTIKWGGCERGNSQLGTLNTRRAGADFGDMQVRPTSMRGHIA